MSHIKGAEFMLHSLGLTQQSFNLLRSPVEDIIPIVPDYSTTRSQRIRKMYLAAFSALLMAVAMGICTGFSAPATYDMTTRPTSPIKPNKDEITWIGSMIAIGAMSGGLLGGPLADKIGRRNVLVLNIIPFITGWLAICFAKNIGTIITGRLFCGIAVGIVSVAVPMYCVEISTSDVRGLLGSSFQGFVVIGNLLSTIIGSYIEWEYLALTGAATATFGLLCFFTMPESPRWLIAQNDMQAAVKVMHKLQGNSVNVEEECNRMSIDLMSQPKGLLTLKECKHPSVYKPALISAILMFFQQFSGANAVLYYSSSIFDGSKSFMDPKKATVILATVQVVATLISNVIVDKVGRKVLLLISGSLMSFSLTVLGIYYYISSYDEVFFHKFNWLPLISLVLFLIAFSMGYGSIPWLLAAEMVPLRARSSVGGLATFTNGLCAFIVTKTFSQLQDVVFTYGAFWTYSCISIIGCIFIVFTIPETKGKELEEIISYFSNPKKDIKDNSLNVTVELENN